MVRIGIDHLCKKFSGRPVLEGVRLEVNSGETVVVLGPSGAGKSTLLRCVVGLCPFDDGEIHVNSWVLRPGPQGLGQAPQIRQRVGFIFQDFALFPHKRAWENVALAPRLVHGLGPREAWEQAMELLGKVGLRSRAEAYPHQLSGGEKQRVAIARALALAPQALLGDEITSALDPELKWEVVETLLRLKGEGLSLLLVTHEVGLARKVADRVVLLADGKVVEEGSPGDVLDRPQSLRGQQFLARLLV
ncbi:MAG: ATP-binding cassette domain-containing protein [Thermoanaerobaculum sp.]|nr:ATP-binding cassette domain-containing protein [Thermoanaerobaculum sp.]